MIKKYSNITSYFFLYAVIAGIKFYAELKNSFRGRLHKGREDLWDPSVIDGYISGNAEKFPAPEDADNLILMDCFPVPLWIAMNGILANALAKKYGAKIVSYCQQSRGAVLNRIYRSFGCNNHIKVRLNLSQKIKHLSIFITSIPDLRDKNALFNWTIDGVRIGEAVYESYLRDFSKPTPQSNSWRFYYSIFKGLEFYIYFSDLLKKVNVACAVLSHECYIATGILAKLCWSKNISVYCANGVEIRRLKKHEDVSIQFKKYKDYFSMLSPEEKVSGEKWGQEELAKIMSGVISGNMSYVEKSAYGSRRIAPQLTGDKKTKILIATHCFYDNPSAYTGMLFNDFYEWLSFLVDISLETDYEWFIKPHRDYLPGTLETINQLIGKNRNIKLVDPEVSWLQLKEEGLTHVLTCYGSVGHELPALDISVINAGHNPHCSYKFNLNPGSIDRYRQILTSLNDSEIIIEDKECIFSFYYVHYFLMKQGGYIFDGYEDYAKYAKNDVYSEEIFRKKFDIDAINIKLNDFIDSGCTSIAEYTLLKRLH